MEEQGIYYFHQGTNYRSYELLGAHFNKEYTIFRVFAPNAKIVSVVGEFNNWDTTTHVMKKISDNGIYEIQIFNVAEYDCYQYAILTKDNRLLFKSDPYGYHCELRPAKASKVYNLDGYQFNDETWLNQRKERQSLSSPINIYEVHLGAWKKYQNGEYFDYQKLAVELASYVKEIDRKSVV